MCLTDALAENEGDDGDGRVNKPTMVEARMGLGTGRGNSPCGRTRLFDSDIRFQVSIVVVFIGWVLAAAIEQYIELDTDQQRLGSQVDQPGKSLDEVQLRLATMLEAMGRLIPVTNASERCQAFVAQLAAD